MTIKCKSCASCGMALEKIEDFALQNSHQDYCKYCTDATGSLLPWDKILKMNVSYYMESQGITESAAQKMAQDFLKSQPAWKGM